MKEMKPSIKELIGPDQKLTFLVGAGCSVDPPSCLPTGRAMIESIINYTCVESEREKILSLDGLRFEAMVEILRDRLDKKLIVIDYYEQCEHPNLQHFFLAEMIIQGQFVMTTNFDFLLERALLQSGVPKANICPVITKSDFEKFQDPTKVLQAGIRPVYKIHGSTKNLISGEDTRSSLITTLQAFGSNKEGLNVFQVEPFKMPLFHNISKGRTLIILGYSGSDDFDIVPTLIALENLTRLIWVRHVANHGATENITEFEATQDVYPSQLSKVDQILTTFKRVNAATRVYRIDAYTPELIAKLIGKQPHLDPRNYLVSPLTWLKQNINSPDDFLQWYIPYKIYEDVGKIGDSLRCVEKLLAITKKTGDQSRKGAVLNNIGLIYYAQGKYLEALKHYEAALQIAEQLGDLPDKAGKASILNNIGLIYDAQGKYPEALKHYEAALQTAEQLDDLAGKVAYLNNIGSIYYNQGNYPEALKRIDGALQIAEQLGDLSGKALDLNNIGSIYYNQGNYSEALKHLEAAFQIAEQLGDLSGKANYLNSIGAIYRDQGNYTEALKRYEAALQIAEQLGDLSEKAKYLNSIGRIHKDQGNYTEALKRYEAALQIAEQLGDLFDKAKYLSNIGWIYYVRRNHSEALKRYEVTLTLLTQIGLGESQEAKAMKKNIQDIKTQLK